MNIGKAALDTTEWRRLFHAYGRATDTPRLLHGLMRKDPAAHQELVEHLFSAIIHQETPWLATAPVARVVAGLIFEESIIYEPKDGSFDETLVTLRSALADFLAMTVSLGREPDADELELLSAYDIEELKNAEDDESFYDDVDASNAVYAYSLRECLEVAHDLLNAVCKRLDDSDARQRAVAAMTAAKLCMTEPLEGQRSMVLERVLAMARSAVSSTERGALVLALNIGAHPIQEFLNDSSRAVRICAALSLNLREDERARQIMAAAINEQPEQINALVEWHPPSLKLPLRWAVLRWLVLISPVIQFERIAVGATAIARWTRRQDVNYEWGPLLQAAFPECNGKIQSESQKQFLKALIENESLWQPVDDEPLRWFKQAGLPYDRRACLKRLS